jgi:ATP-dependent RNA helicase SUPV3L1/SUV3
VSKQKDNDNGKSKFRKKPSKKQKLKSDQPKSFQARSEKQNKIDPDNPFAAALMDFSKKNEGT